MTWTRGNKKGCEGIPDLRHFWTAPKPKNSKIYTILKVERRKILFNHCPPLAFIKVSVADSNHLYKKLPQYYKKKKTPRSYRVCPTSKRKEKEQRNPNLCQISQDQELKKETKKAP